MVLVCREIEHDGFPVVELAPARRPGRPRKLDIERSPSGAPSRKGKRGAAQYCVYMVYFPSAGILKVGRTSDIDRRAIGLKSLKGENLVVCAEFHVRTSGDAIDMELDTIGVLASKGYEREGREWFHVGAEELPGLVDAVARATNVEILGRVCLGDGEHQKSPFASEIASVSRCLFGHRPGAI